MATVTAPVVLVRHCRGTGVEAPDGAHHVMCPFCGSTIHVRRDRRIAAHGKRGPRTGRWAPR